MTYGASLHTDPEDLKSILPTARCEMLTIFPNSATDKARKLAAANITCGKLLEKLIMRHHKSNKALLGVNANR